MTSSKSPNVALIGESYMSYLLGLTFLDNNKATYLINDNRAKYGESWARRIGHLEKSYLKIWGKEFDHGPLKNIDKYITPMPVYFNVDGKITRLGGTPEENNLEFRRKYSPFLEELGTNEFFYKHIEEVASRLFYFYGVQSVQEILSNVSGAEFLQKNCDKFFEKYRGKDHHEWRTFIFAATGFYQGKLTDNLSVVEFNHLYLSLLSPYYYIDEKRLLEDLQSLFTEKGGNLKTAFVEDIQYNKKRPQALELSSYEGIIYPDEIHYLGKFHGTVQFSFGAKGREYRSLIVSLQSDSEFWGNFEKGIYVFSEKSWLGTHNPFWEMQIESDNRSVIRFYYSYGIGSRGQDIYQRHKKRVLKSLEKIFSGFKDNKFEETIEEGFDEIVDVKESGDVTPQFPLQRTLPIKDYRRPASKDFLKKVRYEGPLAGDPLGRLSFYTNIKMLSESF